MQPLMFLPGNYPRFVLFFCLLPLWASIVSNGQSSAIGPSSSVPPGKIVFSALKDGNWDLWMMNSDGTDPIQLTKTPIDERSPCVSFDGKRILYCTSDGNLRLIDMRERSEKKILLPEGFYSNPVWLDSARLLYVSYIFRADKDEVRDDSSIALYELERETSRFNPHILIGQTGMQDWPSISSQGELLYSSSVQGPNQKVTQEIWKYDLRTQNGEQVNLLHANSIQPRWSPDGNEFVFASNTTGNFEIWKYNLNTGKATRLTYTDCSNREPCWSPDGKEIAFISDRQGRNEIWRMASDGKAQGRILPFKEKTECQYPFWFIENVINVP